MVLARKYEKDGNRYEEYKATTKADALEFLRQTEVKDEGSYVSAATPEGALGRDLLEIYDEDTGSRVELPIRHALPAPVKSMTRCAKCGYAVLPISPDKVPEFSVPVEVVLIEEEYDFQENGLGYVCRDCRTLWCAYCTETKGPKANCGICGKEMGPFVE